MEAGPRRVEIMEREGGKGVERYGGRRGRARDGCPLAPDASASL